MSNEQMPNDPNSPATSSVVTDDIGSGHATSGQGARPVKPVPIGRTWSPEVIDLRGLDHLAAPSAPKVKVRVEKHISPLTSMSDQQKMRLYIRVLCELVAYGETGIEDGPGGLDGGDDGSDPEPSLIA